jgi:modulator of FtsH protease HflC
MTRVAGTLLLLVLVILLTGAAYTVNEAEQVIITQFGEPVGGPIATPGLKFKVPIIQKVHRFDKRFLEWGGEVEELPTKDKVFVLVDVYARWRISEPLLFFQRLRNEMGAQSRLDDILDGETRSSIARHELLEVIRSTNRTPVQDESLAGALNEELNPIQEGRDSIRGQILEAARLRTTDLGIEILDVQFKRINYGDQVLTDVYNRMISERKRISERFRSQGQGERANTLGEMDRELNRVRSGAFREAEEIRGRADAEATKIYAAAYNRSVDTRKFYEFLKTMETLEKTVDPSTWLVLSTDSDFFKYLNDSTP